MSEFDFGVILAPGRFKITLAQAQAAWDTFRADPEVDVIIGTEYGSGKFARVFGADGWDHYLGDGECVVAWRTSAFELAWDAHADRIGTTFYRGGNENAQTPLTSVPLRHLAAARILMARAGHFPAHVQAGDGFRKTTVRVIRQGRAWVSSLHTLGRRTRRFAKHHPEADEMVAADLNVDMHRAHWRALVTRVLGLRCVRPLLKGGDLAGRLVSWMFVRGLRVLSVEAMDAQPGFDHRPTKFRLRIKEKP